MKDLDPLYQKLLHRFLVDDDSNSIIAAVRAVRLKLDADGIDPFKVEIGVKGTASQISDRYHYYIKQIDRLKKEIGLYRDWATYLIGRWRQRDMPRFFLSESYTADASRLREIAHQHGLRLVKGRLSPERYALIEFLTDRCWIADIQIEEAEYWIAAHILIRDPTMIETLRNQDLRFDREAYEDIGEGA